VDCREASQIHTSTFDLLINYSFFISPLPQCFECVAAWNFKSIFIFQIQLSWSIKILQITSLDTCFLNKGSNKWANHRFRFLLQFGKFHETRFVYIQAFSLSAWNQELIISVPQGRKISQSNIPTCSLNVSLTSTLAWDYQVIFSCSGCDLVVQAHTEQILEAEGGGSTPVDADFWSQNKKRDFRIQPFSV